MILHWVPSRRQTEENELSVIVFGKCPGSVSREWRKAGKDFLQVCWWADCQDNCHSLLIAQLGCGLSRKLIKEAVNSSHPRSEETIDLLMVVHQWVKSPLEINHLMCLTHPSNSPFRRLRKTATGIYSWNPLVCTRWQMQRTHRKVPSYKTIDFLKPNFIWQNKDRLKCVKISQCCWL